MKKITYIFGLLLLVSLLALSGCGSRDMGDDSSSPSSGGSGSGGSASDITASRVAVPGEVADLVDLGDLQGGAGDNWYTTRVFDISDSGFVAGYSNNGGPVRAAFSWDPATEAMTYLGFHPSFAYDDYYGIEGKTTPNWLIYNEAVSIHSANEIVGNATTGDEDEKRAFYYDGGGLIDLPPVPYLNDEGEWNIKNYSEAVSVNADYVLINSDDKDGRHAYYWDKTLWVNRLLTGSEGDSLETIPFYQRLGIILNEDSSAVGINANNEAIVNSGSTAVFHDLDLDLIETLNHLPGASETKANDINNSGHVTGVSGGKGFFWQAGPMYPLGTLGGGESEGVDINNNDVIVGHSKLANGHIHAFRWQLSGGTGAMTDLGTLGGANSWAIAINDDGIVIGYSETGETYTQGDITASIVHACAWYGGVIYDLGVHNEFYDYDFIDSYPFSEAVALSETGLVTGHSYTINSHYRGFTVDLSSLTP